MIDVNSYIKKNKNTVFLCRDTNPVEFTFDFLKSIPKKTRVLYVTVNKSYSVLADRLKGEGVDFSKWYFIDCISSSLLMAEKSSKQCLYLSSPKSLVDLAIAIDDHLPKFDLVVFDNITGLLSFNDVVSTLQLLNSLMSKIRSTKTRAVYLLFHDTDKQIMEDLALFADKVEII
jgi:hypothetical protein